MGTKEHTYSVQ